MKNTILVLERWTPTSGQRKIGNGPWEAIDLSLYGGKVPFVTLDLELPYGWQREIWMTEEEAKAKNFIK
jgi:hypothetical protein